MRKGLCASKSRDGVAWLRKAFTSLQRRRSVALCVLLVAWPRLDVAAREPNGVDFARDVRPILENFCWKCHGAEKQQGGVRLDRRGDAVSAGDSGKQAVTPGQSADSELIRRVEATDPEQRMPLNSAPLSREQIAILRTWIDKGSNWPQADPTVATGRSELLVTEDDRRHWSYRPLRPVASPAVADSTWVSTAIDRFILAPLEAQGIRPNDAASRRTLIRRVYFDLLGLPPAPEDVEAFVADESPGAYDALVERLLCSPRYGERWGRHWLDVARYADSDGLEFDADRPDAWPYRDFVIRALNDDLSYQTFVRWQLAGDEYDPDNPQALAATGFLTAAPSTVLPQPMEEERLRIRYNELDDMAVTTVSAFLGLTLGCARCHDHKYDAIPTRDYYRLQCAFTTTARDHVLLTTRAEAARFREQESVWKERLAAAQKQLDDWLDAEQEPHRAALRCRKIDALTIGDDEKKLLREQPDSPAAQSLAKRHEQALQLSADDYRRVFDEPQRTRWDALSTTVETVRRTQPPAPPTVLAIAETKVEPEPTWLLDRGDFYSKKSPVQLGFLTVLTGEQSPDDYWAAARLASASNSTTRQRRALADWITDVDHGAGALLARVIVNRVWQHHFGDALVRTVSDFGLRGEPPTHPELLEWLAHEFVVGGWRLKRLHSLILTSSVYRQGTVFDHGRSQRDPDNRLLWRQRLRRLEAEILRDSVLDVSGTLNLESFGPAFKPPIPPAAISARNSTNPYPKDARDTPETRRRTVYLFHKRNVQHPLLQAFDGPDGTVSCGCRNNTTVVPQALALLNDVFFRDRATDFARRLLLESGENPAEWVTRAYLLSLSRPPTETELAASAKFLQRQFRLREARTKSVSLEDLRRSALADYCQVLFGLNEFVYVE